MSFLCKKYEIQEPIIPEFQFFFHNAEQLWTPFSWKQLYAGAYGIPKTYLHLTYSLFNLYIA